MINNNNFVSNMINNSNVIDNNNVSTANDTTVNTAYVDVTVSIITAIATTGTTVLDNTLIKDNNVVETVANVGINSTTSSVALIFSVNAALVQADAKVAEIVMANAANFITTNVTVPASTQNNVPDTNVTVVISIPTTAPSTDVTLLTSIPITTPATYSTYLIVTTSIIKHPMEVPRFYDKILDLVLDGS